MQSLNTGFQPVILLTGFLITQMKELMEKINKQKELHIFHTEKVEEIKKVIEEAKNRSQLIFEFGIHFAEIDEASKCLKLHIVHLLVARFRKLVN